MLQTHLQIEYIVLNNVIQYFSFNKTGYPNREQSSTSQLHLF